MENINDYSKKQADMCIDNDSIPKALYTDYGVKKGLRDENGRSVISSSPLADGFKFFALTAALSQIRQQDRHSRDRHSQ